jgi:hypothetical protein
MVVTKIYDPKLAVEFSHFFSWYLNKILMTTLPFLLFVDFFLYNFTF